MFEEVAKLEKTNSAFAIVTIFKHRGIVPRKSSCMVVSKDSFYGTIGGGQAEREAIDLARKAIKENKKLQATFKSDKGEIMVNIDVLAKHREAHILGFGNVGKELANMFFYAGFEIYIYDENFAEFENAKEIYIGKWKDILKNMKLNKNSACLVTVREKDEIYPFIENSDCSYIGLLASRTRVLDKKYYSPCGFDLGAETPKEIALATVSEALSVINKKSGESLTKRKSNIILVRGAGDLATGTIVKLFKAGYNVIATEIDKPTVIRRNISFAEAVYEKEVVVDNVKAELCTNYDDIYSLLDKNIVPIIIDKDLSILKYLSPFILIDAILAKRNLGTSKQLAPFTIALGPGFEAGKDVDLVIETKRGHSLGIIIKEGSAIENTGVPGIIGGYGLERVIKSPKEGIFKSNKKIGDIVAKGEIIAFVDDEKITTQIAGVIRGMLKEGLYVSKDFKVADVDPRGKDVNINLISDKARCIAGGVLEAVDAYFSTKDLRIE